MKILVTETVTHYHTIEMSDELDIETVLKEANAIKDKCDSGYEALDIVLSKYKKFGDSFAYEVQPNSCGTKCEVIEYECDLD